MALDYFERNGMASPPFCNPATFFMKCMNPEGLLVENMQKTNNYGIDLTDEIKNKFTLRLSSMVKNYKESHLFTDIRSNTNQLEDKEDHKVHYAGWLYQTWMVLKRSFINEMRNPMELKMKIVVNIFMSLLNIIVFYGVDILFISLLIKIYNK